MSYPTSLPRAPRASLDRIGFVLGGATRERSADREFCPYQLDSHNRITHSGQATRGEGEGEWENGRDKRTGGRGDRLQSDNKLPYLRAARTGGDEQEIRYGEGEEGKTPGKITVFKSRQKRRPRLNCTTKESECGSNYGKIDLDTARLNLISRLAWREEGSLCV